MLTKTNDFASSFAIRAEILSLRGILHILVITKPGLSFQNVLWRVESERIPFDVVGPMRFFR